MPGIELSICTLTDLENSILRRRAENAVREISRRTLSACAIALAQWDSADPPYSPTLSAHAASVFLNSNLALVCGISISQPLVMCFGRPESIQGSNTVTVRRAG